MRKTKEEAAITKESLLRAGLTVFSRKGYSTATLEDVAKQAGVTRGAIYWHFGNKAELFNALLEEYSQRGSAIIQAAVNEGGTLMEILERVFVSMLSAIETDPLLREVMEISLFKTEHLQELVEGQRKRMDSSHLILESIAGAIRGGMERGELRRDIDPVEMARAFLALQNGIIYLWLADGCSFPLSRSGKALADIYLHGIVR